jgi:hypothetical protein
MIQWKWRKTAMANPYAITTYTTLRGANGKVIGMIAKNPHTGVHTARKVSGQVVGTYDERRDLTYRVNGVQYSFGNTLAALLVE